MQVAANNFVYLNEFLTTKISYSSISAELVGLAAANDALETVQAFVRHDPNCINHGDTKVKMIYCILLFLRGVGEDTTAPRGGKIEA